MTKKMGYSLISGLILMYGLFIFVQVLNNNVDLISKTSPIGALVATLVSVIMTLLINQETKNEQDSRFEYTVKREIQKQVNSFKINEYHEEIIKLKFVIDETRDIFNLMSRIRGLIMRHDIAKISSEIIKLTAKSAHLLTETTDMLERPEGNSKRSLDYKTIFDNIAPSIDISNEEAEKWLLDNIFVNSAFYNKGTGSYSNSDQLVQILIQLVRLSSEHLTKKVSEMTNYGTKNISINGFKLLANDLESNSRSLKGVKLVLDEVCAKRIRELKNLQKGYLSQT